MGRVDLALHALGIVGGLQPPRQMAVRVRDTRPLKLGQFRLQFGRSHVDPDQAAPLLRGVGLDLHLVAEVALRRLVGHLHADAVHVVLPAVVDAAQPALLVASKEEGRQLVRAERVEDANLALGVAEGHQVLVHDAEAHRRAVGLRQLVRNKRREPETTEKLAHRRAGPGLGQELVLYHGKHSVASSVVACALSKSYTVARIIYRRGPWGYPRESCASTPR